MLSCEGEIKAYSLDQLKQGDMWSLGMLLFVLINPDLEFPYCQELEECKVGNASEARNVLEKHLKQHKKPLHSDTFKSLRLSTWYLVDKMYEACTAFNACERLSAAQVLTMLNEKNDESFQGESTKVEFFY